ncbi:MAG: glycosyltransferase family 4 protein [Chloroflexota bacterium]
MAIATREPVSISTSGSLFRTVQGGRGPRRPRIALFTETFLPRVDGIVNTLCWTLQGLVSAGWEPVVIAPHGNTQSVYGVPIIGANSTPCPIYPELRLGMIGPGVCQQLDAFQPDIIHLVGPAMVGLGGLIYAQSRQIPAIASYHTNLPQYAHYYSLGWLEGSVWAALKAIHNRCAMTLCPSQAVLRQLQRQGFERLQHWARGVDSALFAPTRRSDEWRQRLGAQPGTTLLLFVGRLAPEKRVQELELLLRAMPNVALAVVGDGPARTDLERSFADLPVTFTGYLKGADLASAYASADVFVFPSDSEAFGNVVLEAMASGLPVVAAAAGGVLDLIKPMSTGLIYEPGNIVELTHHVSRYVANEPLRNRHGAAGRATAETYTWDRQLGTLLDYYSQTIASAQRLAA